MDFNRTTASQFHQSEILKQESITNNRGNLTTLHRRSKPLRYRGMAHPRLKPGESAKEVLTRSVKATADVVPNPTVSEP
jgi:hypothetical protein